jgi:hypothetical protein
MNTKNSAIPAHVWRGWLLNLAFTALGSTLPLP